MPVTTRSAYARVIARPSLARVFVFGLAAGAFGLVAGACTETDEEPIIDEVETPVDTLDLNDPDSPVIDSDTAPDPEDDDGADDN